MFSILKQNELEHVIWHYNKSPTVAQSDRNRDVSGIFIFSILEYRLQATNPDICTQLAVQVHEYFIIPLVLKMKLLRVFLKKNFRTVSSSAEFPCSSCCCINTYIMGIASAIPMISKLILTQQREIFNIKICTVHCRSKTNAISIHSKTILQQPHFHHGSVYPCHSTDSCRVYDMANTDGLPILFKAGGSTHACGAFLQLSLYTLTNSWRPVMTHPSTAHLSPWKYSLIINLHE